jgi:hypothetical protein
MAKATPGTPKAQPGSPEGILAKYFREEYPGIYKKVRLQVRRTPRRQTGKWKTNRECRWTLNPKHPDYTAADQICGIEAKLFASTLEFDEAPTPRAAVAQAARAVLGKNAVAGAYRCPVSGRRMNFKELEDAADNPTHGRSAFQVGHVRPKGKAGLNKAENVYWNTDLGNRIQGDKTLADTIKTIIEMAEFHRQREGNITWGELVNRYLD